ncbi:MAG: alpha/beta hydrolase [Bacteroidetes bacterium]|nr:alpha/beta hydrolase [Bacteroidota bacterium]
MKKPIIFGTLITLALIAFINTNHAETVDYRKPDIEKDTLIFKKGYSNVNGIEMYYEIYGQGKPLVLIHGGGSTIQTTFGRVIPMLSEKYQVIAMDLQAHGRTSDRNSALSFEQDADDIATLLKNLAISKADFFGFSNGGTTTMQIAIRHPQIVGKIILASTLSKRNGVPDQFWEFMKKARLDNMPVELKEAYRQVAPNPANLQIMHDKDAARMIKFTDIPDEKIKSINAPALIIIGDKDVITPEHAITMHRLIANSSLAIIPGVHGEYIGEITTLQSGSNEAKFVIPMIENFLKLTIH